MVKRKNTEKRNKKSGELKDMKEKNAKSCELCVSII